MIDDDDFDGRELCPDDTCVGLIGADGRCKECSAIAELPERDRGELEPVDPADDDAGDATDADDADAAEPDIEPARDRAPEPDGFEADGRDLCPDGTCIGLVGDDGRCKECGRDARAA